MMSRVNLELERIVSLRIGQRLRIDQTLRFDQAWRFVLAWTILLCVALVCPAAENSEPLLPGEPPLVSGDWTHWAYRPLKRSPVPAVRDAAWCRNPLDAFILARLEAAKLQPLPEADRATLLRRLRYDLTGLPPTLEETESFLADSAPDAYERLVDRLLASSDYGVRWAQHWLDLARFAETDGFEHDHPRPEAWRYRDWVVQALNADLPYDEFVRLQLAGDELRPNDPEAARATGFVLCGPDMPDLNLPEERRHMVLNELTGTVGSVFLGLQFSCASCHDHKYDPVSQADFYRLRAFFDNTQLFDKQAAGRVLSEPVKTPVVSRVWLRGDFRRPGPEISPAFPRIANPRKSSPELSKKSSQGRRTALAEWLTHSDQPLVTRVFVNRLWQYHFGRGLSPTPSDFGLMGTEPSHPELLDWLATELPRQNWSWKQMHRLIVTSTTYRLASRPTLNDDVPTDPATLATWRALLAADPDNQFLGRFRRQRISGETIRDALLLISGQLNSQAGGPGVMTPLPVEVQRTVRGDNWKVHPDPAQHVRRSLYVFARRNLRQPLFEVYDQPDSTATCPTRPRSTTAPQALTLLNADLTRDAARRLAAWTLRAAQDAQRLDDRQLWITLCYQKTFGRLPSASEVTLCRSFLQDQAAFLAQTGRTPNDLALPETRPARVAPVEAAALTDLCLALFNLNEFVYVD